MQYGAYLGKSIRGVPFVHGLQVLLLAVDHQVRPIVAVLHAAVSEDARELKDAVLDGVKSAHLQIHPKQLRHEVNAHLSNYYITHPYIYAQLYNPSIPLLESNEPHATANNIYPTTQLQP